MQGVWVRGTAGIAIAGAVACLIVGLIGGAGGASAAVGSTDLSMTKADTADPVTVGDWTLATTDLRPYPTSS